MARLAGEMRSTTTSGKLGGQSRHLSVALTTLGCAVTLAACGSSGSRPKTSDGPYGPKSSPAALSRCMRANGVSSFPDPIAGPGGVGLPLMVGSDGTLTAEGKTFAGPVLQSAERACRTYLPPAGGPPQQVSASQRRQALTFARCMRARGVPSFPDPTFSAGAAAGTPAIDPQSPAFRSAAHECGGGGNGWISSPG